MITNELRSALTKRQAEVIEYVQQYDPRHLILEGAVRSAKTICNIFLFLRHVRKYKDQKKNSLFLVHQLRVLKEMY